jgi:hypothetical protein
MIKKMVNKISKTVVKPIDFGAKQKRKMFNPRKN